MSKTFRCLVLAPMLMTVWTTAALAQALPTSQPQVLVIYREQIKLGHNAAHLKTESGWPAAFARADSPDYYLAMASMTGPSEVWFAQPWDSYAAWGQAMERNQANPRLTAALERQSMADAEHLDVSSIIEAVAVPEMSYGDFPDLNMARFWQVTTLRLRPGHEAQFAEAVNVYKTVAGRADPNAKWRVYRVTNGMRGGTFLIYSSVESFGQFDNMMAGDAAIGAAMTPEEGEKMQKFSAEAVLSAISNRFRLDPDMSYVSDETKATDPDFWKINR